VGSGAAQQEDGLAHDSAAQHGSTRRGLTALQELSEASAPDAVVLPAGRAALVRVMQAMRNHPEACRWPKPHQIVGLAFCDLVKDRAIVADDMGLGKTSLAICRVVLAQHYPALVICPTSVVGSWLSEWREWFPGIAVRKLLKARDSVPQHGWQGVILTTWDMLRHHVSALVALKPQIVVSDEAHAITYNTESKRSQAHALIVKAAPHVLLLTGTPVKNTAMELWRLLCLLDARWEKREDAFRYITKDDLLRRDAGPLSLAVRNYMVRRVKAQALAALTPKRYRYINVHPSTRAMTRYHYIEKKFKAWLQGEMERRLAAELEGVDAEERREAIAERVHRTLEAESLVKMGYLRRAVGIMKAPAAVRWVQNMHELGEAVVVFAEHQEVLHHVARALTRERTPFVMVEGRTSKSKRDRAIAAFQDGDIDVFLASQAAKEGITLHRARHLLFIERWWTPAAEDQAADRVHRLGQLGDVCIWMLRIRGTVDDRMAVINTKKRVIFRRMVNREVVKKE
jgi:SNF2 family DNA or RNA helicase